MLAERGPGALARAIEAGDRDEAGPQPDPDSTPRDRCEWTLFRNSTVESQQYRYGSCWRGWGIYRSTDRWYRGTHLPSGLVLTEFDALRIARRFCEAIEALTDWSQPLGELRADKELGSLGTARRYALTGARMTLRALDWGRS